MADEKNTNPSPVDDPEAAARAASEARSEGQSHESDDPEALARAASEAREAGQEPGNPGEQVNETPEQSTELDTETWGTTGDEIGDSVLLLLQNSGVEVETAKALLYDAVVEGDPTKIDRDALVEKFGKAHANLILAGVENYVGKQQQLIAEVTSTVHKAAGSKENWTKVTTWANKSVPAETRNELAGMLDKGGEAARYAATRFVELYNADEKNTSLGTTTRIDGDAKAPNSGRAISRREYAEELQKAHRMGANPAVLKEIQAARERGRKRGL